MGSAPQNYADYYALLNLAPDADWPMVRTQYRRLVGQWHPDRFSDDPDKQRYAEARTKQIVGAYHALEQFHRDHGALPGIVSAAAKLAADRATRVDSAREARDASGLGRTFDTRVGRDAHRVAVRKGSKASRRIVLATLVLVAGTYALYRYVWTEEQAGDAPPAVMAHEPSAAPRLREAPEESTEQQTISIGSTFGDVYAIQGIPTRTEGNTWFYGDSKIRFFEGSVVSWEESPGHPLRTPHEQPGALRSGHFKVGSSKDEVRAIQGVPVTESATVWDYGLSRVYFRQNRVVRWEESPLQPLRVPH